MFPRTLEYPPWVTPGTWVHSKQGDQFAVIVREPIDMMAHPYITMRLRGSSESFEIRVDDFTARWAYHEGVPRVTGWARLLDEDLF